ncbi:MAG: HEAT repeat domain-containing protein, partial [Vicinamibacterales bacterium]
MAETVGVAIALSLSLAFAGCASVPPAPAAPPGPTFEEKLSAILKLEDERRLREPAPPELPSPVAVTRGRRPAPPAAPPPPPDLLRWLSDDEARVRRRAALAVGRVKSSEGVAGLVALLKDPDPEVRQMAAFALGLIGDAGGRDALVVALGDEQHIVKGSAAEALGLIGDPAAADAVARMASTLIAAGALAQLPTDDDDTRRDTASAAIRLAIVSLVRLKAFDALASVVLDAGGQPRFRWWPVAFALQRLEDPRGKEALLTLARESHPYTRAFAVRGLGAVGRAAGRNDGSVVTLLTSLASGDDRMTAVEAIRALARLAEPSAGATVAALIRNVKSDPYLRLEAVLAAATVPDPALDDLLLDTLADPTPAIRTATLRALARRDPSSFVTILSGLDTDQEWTVRAGLAEILGTLPPEAGLPRLRTLLQDSDQRVIPAALAALARLNPKDAATLLAERLKAEDPIVRAAAAQGLATVKAGMQGAALAAAYHTGQRDTTYVARAAALTALAELRSPEAATTLTEALADKDWAVRVKAATLLERLEAASNADARIRPAPTGRPPEYYNAA